MRGADYPDIPATRRAEIRELIDAARARADADCAHLIATPLTPRGGSEVQATQDPQRPRLMTRTPPGPHPDPGSRSEPAFRVGPTDPGLRPGPTRDQDEPETDHAAPGGRGVKVASVRGARC